MPHLPTPGNAETPLKVELSCHPVQACPPVRSLQARASLLDPGTLSLGFTLTGELDRLVIPPQGFPERRDGLWEHTCFEAFLAVEGMETYHEANLSPSTAWATYTFPRYREEGRPAPGLEPRMVVHRWPDRLELHTLLGLEGTIDWNLGRRLRLGLTAVIELKGGGCSYWAIRHPEGPPDFHHPGTFALTLSPLPEEA